MRILNLAISVFCLFSLASYADAPKDSNHKATEVTKKHSAVESGTFDEEIAQPLMEQAQRLEELSGELLRTFDQMTKLSAGGNEAGGKFSEQLTSYERILVELEDHAEIANLASIQDCKALNKLFEQVTETYKSLPEKTQATFNADFSSVTKQHEVDQMHCKLIKKTNKRKQP